MKVNRASIPEYVAAVETENQLRDAAFIDPLTEILPGLVIRQMTPADFIVLDGLDSPLLSGRPAQPAELALFLWILSPRCDSRLHRFWRWLHMRRCRVFDLWADIGRADVWAAADAAVGRYLESTFADGPGGGATTIPYAGWCAHLVNRVASAYGWPEEQIMRIPFRRLYQYLRCIRRDIDPQSVFINTRSDGVLSEHRRRKKAQ